MTTTDAMEYFHARRTLASMLGSRGFDARLLEMESEHDVATMLSNDALNFRLTHQDGGGTVYVHFVTDGRTLKTNDVSNITESYKDSLKTSDTLLIVAAKATSTVDGQLRSIWNASGLFVQVFTLDHLQWDKTKHREWIPHRVLSASETAEITKRFKTLDVLPMLSREDAAAAWIGLRPGQVCEVTRRSVTTGTSTAYRLCMNELPSGQ